VKLKIICTDHDSATILAEQEKAAWNLMVAKLTQQTFSSDFQTCKENFGNSEFANLKTRNLLESIPD
jgi:hypothetical protein